MKIIPISKTQYLEVDKWEELDAVYDQYEVVSFDIFDTLLFRKYLTLQDILAISSEHLNSYVDIKRGTAFTIKMRHQIAHLLKKSISLDTQEPTLLEIFCRLLDGNCLEYTEKISAASECVCYELELEKANLQVISGAKEFLTKLKESNKKILAVSDMYFEQSEMEVILEKNQLLEFFDHVFISSTSKKTKYNKDLFSHVIDSLELRDSRILHIGDNVESDVKNAIDSGIDAVHFTGSSLKAYSVSSDNFKMETLTSNLARLSIGFVIDIFEQCKKFNVNRIYFLSRDGTVFLDIAERLATKNPILKCLSNNLEFRELNVSRALTVFFELDKDNTIEDICYKFLHVSNGEFTLLELFSFLAEENDQRFNLSQEKEFISIVWNEKSIKQLIEIFNNEKSELKSSLIETAKSHADRSFRYLIQEGMVGQGKVALVDVGYTSSFTTRVAAYLTNEKYDTFHHNTQIYNFLLVAGPLRHKNDYNSFPYSKYINDSFIQYEHLPTLLKGNFSWIEIFFSDRRRGPLEKYVEDCIGNVCAQFKVPENSFEQPILLEVDKIIENLQDEELLLLMSPRYIHRLTNNILKRFSIPNPRLVSDIEKLTFYVGQTDKLSKTIIKSNLNLKDFTLKNYRQNIASEIWYSGSIIASGKKYLFVVLFIERYLVEVMKGIKETLRNLARPVAKIFREFI